MFLFLLKAGQGMLKRETVNEKRWKIQEREGKSMKPCVEAIKWRGQAHRGVVPLEGVGTCSP